MTYCVALNLNEGLVLLSDTRTNAGMDNIARYKKMFLWSTPGERMIAAVTAGNLGITQGVITVIDNAVKESRVNPEQESILTCPTLYRAAELFGDAMLSLQSRDRARIEAQGAAADASMIVAGQRRDGQLRLFLIYSAGNFIEATEDTPYFQIGEHKYGKPILDRVITRATPLDAAVKAVLVSMDSTLRSNLSVGMPLDLAIIRNGVYGVAETRRFEADDPSFRAVSEHWSQALRSAFLSLPEVPLKAPSSSGSA
jgi:putative proteasome-type protease